VSSKSVCLTISCLPCQQSLHVPLDIVFVNAFVSTQNN